MIITFVIGMVLLWLTLTLIIENLLFKIKQDKKYRR